MLIKTQSQIKQLNQEQKKLTGRITKKQQRIHRRTYRKMTKKNYQRTTKRQRTYHQKTTKLTNVKKHRKTGKPTERLLQP